MLLIQSTNVIKGYYGLIGLEAKENMDTPISIFLTICGHTSIIGANGGVAYHTLTMVPAYSLWTSAISFLSVNVKIEL